MSGLKHDVCTKRVMKELKDQNKYTSYEMVPVDDNIYICLVRFGVYSGDYAGQEHVMEVKFAWGSGEVHHFPYDPPLMTFKTPILHPNIGEYPGGAICLDFLKQSGLWSPTCTVLGLVDMIRALLLDPNPSSPQNAKAGTLYTTAMKNKEDWAKMTMKYYKEHIKGCRELMDRFSDKKLQDDKVEEPKSDNDDGAEDDSVSSLSMPSDELESESEELPKPAKSSSSSSSISREKKSSKSEKPKKPKKIEKALKVVKVPKKKKVVDDDSEEPEIIIKKVSKKVEKSKVSKESETKKSETKEAKETKKSTKK